MWALYPKACLSVFVHRAYTRKLGPDPNLPPQPLVSSPLQPASEGSEGTPLRRAGETSDCHFYLNTASLQRLLATSIAFKTKESRGNNHLPSEMACQWSLLWFLSSLSTLSCLQFANILWLLFSSYSYTCVIVFLMDSIFHHMLVYLCLFPTNWSNWPLSVELPTSSHKDSVTPLLSLWLSHCLLTVAAILSSIFWLTF